MSGVLQPKIPPPGRALELDDDPAASAATRTGAHTHEIVRNAPDTAESEDRPVVAWVRERRTRIQH